MPEETSEFALLEWRVDPDGEDGLLASCVMVGKLFGGELTSVGLFLAGEEGKTA